ncbi:unnamed protein product [Paramecium octaurelia]|uniref:Uncharacterized protein n=1 Tax=Paramecium octaurelia TaxID=43137 RepID=A0A8S1VJ76_PAROT|nr:unnamed protein product [Paramecium octaurelia]
MKQSVEFNNYQLIEEPYSWQGTQKVEELIQDNLLAQYQRLKVRIAITKENDLYYIRDGQILRMQFQKSISYNSDKMMIPSKLPNILYNLEQIQYLQWEGEYSKSNEKIGKWKAKWKGETLIDVGGYYNWDEKKHGLWKDIIQNYSKLVQVYECGIYNNDKKQGEWKYLYEEEKIGGGIYNQKSQKNGKWIDLSDDFMQDTYVTYSGEYKNDNKIGLWEIWLKHKKRAFTPYNTQCIGGGSYDDRGDGIKIGRWIELSDRLYERILITYNGQYRNGKKAGRWDIWLIQQSIYQSHKTNLLMQTQLYKDLHNVKSGGGSYNGENGVKIGKWIEINVGFSEHELITSSGEYRNGKKVGRWQTLDEMGGGQYAEKGQDLKSGRLIERSYDFSNDLKVFYKGQYNDGKKIGKWEIENERMQIGGGYYDEGQNGFKVGRWIELCEESRSNSLITFTGEYQYGKKIGRWDIWYQNYEKNKQIGGGLYDEKGLNIKIGKWIELSDRFSQGEKVIYSGEYKNNTRIGRWDIWYQKDKEFQRIGGGQYEDDGIKIGKWIELSKEFRSDYQPSEQITYHGEYNNGKKVGIWVEMNQKYKKLKELKYNN